MTHRRSGGLAAHTIKPSCQEGLKVVFDGRSQIQGEDPRPVTAGAGDEVLGGGRGLGGDEPHGPVQRASTAVADPRVGGAFQPIEPRVAPHGARPTAASNVVTRSSNSPTSRRRRACWAR